VPNLPSGEKNDDDTHDRYNYERGGHAMDMMPVPKPVAQFATSNTAGPRIKSIDCLSWRPNWFADGSP
jgi:hypothetical protein